MHYRNGREAKSGDKVLVLTTGQSGMVYNLNAQAQTCNARVASVTPSDPYVNLSDCVHQDDVAAAFPLPA
jgi:hypothetical protein